MRDFLNAILAWIGSTSLTDAEFAAFDLTGLSPAVYTVDLYNRVGAVLLSRESVSTITDRLKYMFLAKGINVDAISKAKSNIYIGDAL